MQDFVCHMALLCLYDLVHLINEVHQVVKELIIPSIAFFSKSKYFPSCHSGLDIKLQSLHLQWGYVPQVVFKYFPYHSFKKVSKHVPSASIYTHLARLTMHQLTIVSISHVFYCVRVYWDKL
jgi:hypothetical protein